MSPRRIGRALKRLREETGLSQLALAKRAKVSQAYISEIEAGQRRNPGIETLTKIAKGSRRAGDGVVGMNEPRPRGEDVCRCGHERVAHEEEPRYGWTVCSVEGCGCVRFVKAEG